jgi:hypothetical protein
MIHGLIVYELRSYELNSKSFLELTCLRAEAQLRALRHTWVPPLDSMFHSPSIPTGYEPKPRSLLLHHSASPRREKVSDDLLKTLPGFSYSLVERRNFEKAFGSMLRSIGGVFLLKNVRRLNPDLVAHTSASPSVKIAPRFFSPKLDRAALAAQNGPSVFYAEAAPYLSPEAKYGGGGLLMPSPVGDLYGS